MNKNSRICVAGSEGLLGHAIIGQLEKIGYKNVIHCDRPQIDLCNQKESEQFFNQEKPEYIFFLLLLQEEFNLRRVFRQICC